MPREDLVNLCFRWSLTTIPSSTFRRSRHAGPAASTATGYVSCVALGERALDPAGPAGGPDATDDLPTFGRLEPGVRRCTAVWVMPGLSAAQLSSCYWIVPGCCICKRT